MPDFHAPQQRRLGAGEGRRQLRRLQLSRARIALRPSGGRCAASAFLWLLLLVGVALVPNPSVMNLLTVGMLLFVTWIVTARRILEASWFQTFILQVFGVFTIVVLGLLIEVGHSLLEL